MLAEALTMTIEDVEERLHCKRTRIFELLRADRLTRAKRLGKVLTITRESVERLERELAGVKEPRRSRRRSPVKPTKPSDAFAALRPTE